VAVKVGTVKHARRGEGKVVHAGNPVYCMSLPVSSARLTARNLYNRGHEHTSNYQKRQKESFIQKHQVDTNNGMEADFTAKVLCSYKDCLSRQTAEGVHIRRCDKEILNSKAEWHQPALWKVRSELCNE
jgi:hypothetical protein